jgi:hypothetical protein
MKQDYTLSSEQIAGIEQHDKKRTELVEAVKRDWEIKKKKQNERINKLPAKR